MDKFKKGCKWFFESFIWLGLLLLLIDVLSKYFITLNKESILNAGERGIDVIPGFLSISYLINNNVAFGLGSSDPNVNRIVFIVLSLLISIGIIVFLVLRYNKIRKLYRAVACMVIAGALGNASDRLFYSPQFQSCPPKIVVEVPGVVDWIDFHVWDFRFNIADSCVVIGAFIIIIALIVEAIKESRNNKTKEKKPTEKILSKTEITTKELREKDRKIDE